MRQKIALISLASYCLNWDGEFVKSGGLPPSRQLQFHYLYRSVGAYLQFTAIVDLTGVAEAALLHHASAGRVIDEMPAYEGLDARRFANVPYHQFQGLRANAFIPIRFGNPISRDGFAIPRRKGAIT